jgi:flavin-binding protein dodecin
MRMIWKDIYVAAVASTSWERAVRHCAEVAAAEKVEIARLDDTGGVVDNKVNRSYILETSGHRIQESEVNPNA